jgi:hypothetical protein
MSLKVQGCQGNLKDFSYLVPCLQYTVKKKEEKKKGPLIMSYDSTAPKHLIL